LIAGREAVPANETDRFWDFNETKSTALIETMVQQLSYARWTFEIESRERRLIETPRRENSDPPTNTKSFGRAQISNQFATVSPQQAIIPNAKVGTVHNKRKTIVQPTANVALDELNG
jgi:hypothetical protein